MKKVFLKDLDYKNLITKIGFTKTETRVILFLVFTFLIGFLYSKISNGAGSPYKEYDYSVQDSLFYAAYNQEDNISESYKSEFLDSSKSFVVKPAKIIPMENSIDINSAGMDELMKLPGVGEKTAQNIIDYRNKNGNFRSLQDILNVKGIGKVKLEKITKYINIK